MCFLVAKHNNMCFSITFGVCKKYWIIKGLLEQKCMSNYIKSRYSCLDGVLLLSKCSKSCLPAAWSWKRYSKNKHCRLQNKCP